VHDCADQVIVNTIEVCSLEGSGIAFLLTRLSTVVMTFKY